MKSINYYDHFFNSNKINKQTAYVLGLMWADGYIYPKQNRVSITCIKSDLDDVSSIISNTAKWRTYIRKAKGVRKEQLTFMIHDKNFCELLTSYKYVSKKYDSACKILNIIPIELQKYWWRGFLDGDGCIYTGKNYQVFFTSALNQDWNFINILPLKLSWKTVKKQTNKGNYSRRLLNNKNDCLLLLNYIYDNYENDKIGFTRKYLKYLEMKREKIKKFLGKGCYLNKKVNKWCARITFNKKDIALGYYDTEEEANKAVTNKRLELNLN